MKTNPAHLLHFVAIIESGSFGAAARELGLSQPALSRNIKLLEDRIGAQLLTRSRNGIALTEIGELIYGHGQSMKNSFDLASDLAAAIAAGKTGRLRIGAPPYLADSLLADPVNDFFQRHSDVRLDVETATASELRQSLRSGSLDLAILPAEVLHADDPLRYERLFQDRTAIFAGAQHPLAEKPSVDIADLSNQNWLAHPADSLLRSQMDTLLLTLGLSTIKIAIQVQSRSMVVRLLEKQDTLTVLPRSYFSDELKSRRLVTLPLAAQYPERPIAIAFHAIRPSTPVARKFRTFIKRWASQL